ncbi:MAG TPA: sugar ABC transporter ATP-binding protein [Rectinemataceae bacterium]|nr:sugar ABC transporter ATP-binding protein [Rectinemataceae bacterium]
MSPPLLELRSLGKVFSPDFALDDITLSLDRGEVNVLVGQNGSGKSALMGLVAGQYSPDSGTIFLDGEAVDFGSMHESRKAGITFQRQDPQLYNNLNVAENVFFHRVSARKFGLRLVDPYRIREECAELFAELGIAIDPGDLVADLGYTQRLLILAVQTYVADSKIVIFDEPTAGMTDPEREILFAIVRAIRRRGAGIFYISHKLDEVGLVGDRVTVIHQGRMTGSLRCADAGRDRLIALMTGRNHSERYPRLDLDQGQRVLSVEGLQSGSVLRDVNFTLHKGEILGITGLMGSGRTRLAQCLFGVTRPSAGSIKIEGAKAAFGHPAEAMARGMALIPEDRDNDAVFHFHDIVQNMSIAALPRFRGSSGLNQRYMHELTSEYIRNLAIRPGHAGDFMRDYSGGNQQKVIVARWLMSLCRIFIMDEPTRGIDAAARIDIYNAMNDLISKGAAIILISSDVDEILGMCDRVLVLARGRIVRDIAHGGATKEEILDFASG